MVYTRKKYKRRYKRRRAAAGRPYKRSKFLKWYKKKKAAKKWKRGFGKRGITAPTNGLIPAYKWATVEFRAYNLFNANTGTAGFGNDMLWYRCNSAFDPCVGTTNTNRSNQQTSWYRWLGNLYNKYYVRKSSITVRVSQYHSAANPLTGHDTTPVRLFILKDNNAAVADDPLYGEAFWSNPNCMHTVIRPNLSGDACVKIKHSYHAKYDFPQCKDAYETGAAIGSNPTLVRYWGVSMAPIDNAAHEGTNAAFHMDIYIRMRVCYFDPKDMSNLGNVSLIVHPTNAQ